MNRKQYYSRHDVSPYLKKLGKRLFNLALEISRYKEKPTKQRIIDLVRKKKAKNQTIPHSLAWELVAECVEKVKKNRDTRTIGKFDPKWNRLEILGTHQIPKPIWETPIAKWLEEYRAVKLKQKANAVASRFNTFRYCTNGHENRVKFVDKPEDVKVWSETVDSGERYKGKFKSKPIKNSIFHIHVMEEILSSEHYNDALDFTPIRIISREAVAYPYGEDKKAYVDHVLTVKQGRGTSLEMCNAYIAWIKHSKRTAHTKYSASTAKAALAGLKAYDPEHIAEIQAKRRAKEDALLAGVKILDKLMSNCKMFDGNLSDVLFINRLKNVTEEDIEQAMNAVKFSLGAMSEEMKKNAEDFARAGNRKVAV